MEKQEWFCLKKDVAGSQQLCAWQTTGAEATIHAMYDIFKEHNTEGIQLIDAENAFNSINGKVMFHNLKIICSIIAAYISVTYVLGGCLSLAGVNCYLMREQLNGRLLSRYTTAAAISVRFYFHQWTQSKNVAFADFPVAGKLTSTKSIWTN